MDTTSETQTNADVNIDSFDIQSTISIKTIVVADIEEWKAFLLHDSPDRTL